MSGGAWSNDQLNELYIYDPVTGALILSITNAGFYYVVGEATYLIDAQGLKARLTADNGSYAALLPRNAYNGTRLDLQPADYPPGTAWAFPGYIDAGYITRTGPTYQPSLTIASPAALAADVAEVEVYGRTTDGLIRPAVLFECERMIGRQGGDMGLGTLDAWETSPTASLNFTSATDVIAFNSYAFFFGNVGFRDYRAYEVTFSGTVQSNAATNRIGLRIYRGPTFNSLVGATLVGDYGQITIANTSVPQPFSITAMFNGVASDQYAYLAVRRTSGAGTCNIVTMSARLSDQTPDL